MATPENSKDKHIQAFSVVLGVATVLSCYASVSMSLQSYAVQHLAITHPHGTKPFLDRSFWMRQLARSSAWLSVVLFLAALGIWGSYTFTLSSGAGVTLVTLMAVGAAAVLATWRFTNRLYLAAKK